ncbi:class I SAM-dependent DNA methyltransferase [Pseudooceanicola onchidii]|uniref:class I SAM-dependent DNA methyltransferase n=1 Tax=Pseudooceanicola onchidii TaxID=2562279 RepID=UPI0010AA23FA|nr:class I SAM-dependent methyltransferase [Pseudooceanicola onchidii]
MTADARTLAVYDEAARKYGQRRGLDWENDALDAFLARLPPDALVLDLGCGPGHHALRMMASGRSVDAVDASPGMVARAIDSGVPARLARFDQIDGDALYDGAWANFTLLHAPRDAVPGHLQRLHRALKPGGVIHIGFKVGTGEGRDSLDRFYTYWEVAEMHRALDLAGVIVDEEVRRGKGTGLDSSPFGWALMTGVKRP